MAYDASDILGAPQVAGARVMDTGYIARHAAGMGGVGLAGGATGAILSSSATEFVERHEKRSQSDSDTPALRGGAFLAATADELALVSVKVGMLKSSLGQVLARLPRSDVKSVNYESGMVSKLTVSLVDETTWAFHVPKNGSKAAKEFAAELGA